MRRKGSLSEADTAFGPIPCARWRTKSRNLVDRRHPYDFRARYVRYYSEYIDLLMAQKQPELAFHMLSAGGQVLLETLAVARVDIHTGAEFELLR